MSEGIVDNFFIKKSVKKFGNVKMSVVFRDGDNPFTGFLLPPLVYFPPPFTTTIGLPDSKNEDFSPLVVPLGPVFLLYIIPSKLFYLWYIKRGNTLVC